MCHYMETGVHVQALSNSQISARYTRYLHEGCPVNVSRQDSNSYSMQIISSTALFIENTQ